jgi:hypothetical protein
LSALYLGRPQVRKAQQVQFFSDSGNIVNNVYTFLLGYKQHSAARVLNTPDMTSNMTPLSTHVHVILPQAKKSSPCLHVILLRAKESLPLSSAKMCAWLAVLRMHDGYFGIPVATINLSLNESSFSNWHGLIVTPIGEVL